MSYDYKPARTDTNSERLHIRPHFPDVSDVKVSVGSCSLKVPRRETPFHSLKNSCHPNLTPSSSSDGHETSGQ